MKLGHVLLLPLVPVALLGGCSDPPSAPAEAAAYISVSPGAGTCNATHGLLFMPLDQRVYDNLKCSLANESCSPDGIVAVDGDDQTRVSCDITQSGTSYNVNGSFTFKGDDITVSGQIPETGGTVRMTHYFRDRGVGLNGSCTLSIVDNLGTVAPGRVWAHFTCPAFTDPGAAGGMDCAAEGSFLFQKCGGG